MPQVLKPEVRARILDASLRVFAELGFARATMATIAERAGLGSASLYRYYASKGELFDTVITSELASEFERLLVKRVRALAQASARSFAPRRDYGQEMLDFWLEHRLAVVVLLDRAQGTAYEPYGQRFVSLLVKSTIEQMRAAEPGIEITAAARFVLTRIFESTRRTLAEILAHTSDQRVLRETIEAFWSYQIPGLHGLRAWLSRHNHGPGTR